MSSVIDIIANHYSLSNDQVEQMSVGVFLLKHKDYYVNLKIKLDNKPKPRHGRK